MLKKIVIGCWMTMGILGHLHAQTTKTRWVDSVFNSMDQEGKIGQLFMVPIHAGTDKNYRQNLDDLIKEYHIGGAVFMDGGPGQTAHLANHVQRVSKVPMLLGIDAQWGLGKQLDSTMRFPPAIAQGAVRDDTLIYRMATEIGRQIKMLGLHINFAPNASLKMAKNDSIGRSFGENNANVTHKSLSYLRGLQSQGVLSCAKYFPVEGITVLNVQKDGIPTLNPFVDSLKIHPFEKLFKAGLTGVVPASSEFPLFYENKKVIKKNKVSPALLSSIYAGSWLKQHMGYSGLVFVSIHDIQSQTGKYSGDAELLAFQTGNDVILFPEDLGPAVRKIKRLLRKESRYEIQLDNIVKKILSVKYDAGLNHVVPAETDNLQQRLNTKEALILKQRLIERSITVVNNKNDLLPLQILEDRKIALLSMGIENTDVVGRYMAKYAHITHFTVKQAADTSGLLTALKNYNTIIITVFPSAAKWKNKLLPKLASWQSDRDIILCHLGSPLLLNGLESFTTTVETYYNDADVQRILPQTIFGSVDLDGVLPQDVSLTIREGMSCMTPSLERLGYAIPEDVRMDSRVLKKIEAIAQEAIDTKATPGCHVLVAKDGKVVYDKSFGWQTYEKKVPVTDETIYDLASVTKVMATLQTVMFMHDRKLIDINKKASYYLPELKQSNKKDFTIKDILTHQAGLWPFLPFWAQTVRDSLFMPEFYSSTFNEQFPYEVADSLYGSTAMRDSLWNWVITAKVREKPFRTPFDYRYSDMGFYIMQHVAEKVLNQPIDDFLNQNLYEPLGAHTTGYLPLKRFAKTQIAPTENDRVFRRRLLIGTVHDQGAAMNGGVAGHAGLFSDANDLAKVGQMLLQEGYYGGIQYYKPQTVRLFTQQQYESSRRGLGWDRPTQSDWNGPTSLYASPKTFGHTGFTGTCIWVDPEFNLVYIFLSNRVHPNMTNNKLLQANIRSRIQDVIYQAIFSYCENN